MIMNSTCQGTIACFTTASCETRQVVAVEPKMTYKLPWNRSFGDIKSNTSVFLSRQKLLDNEIGTTWTELLGVLTIIDISDCNPYTDVSSFVSKLNSVRKQKPYRHIFFLMKNEDKNIKGVLLFGLSQIPYEAILPEEEKFVVEQLHSSDSDVQGWALNALQCWDDIGNLQVMTDVDATNKYIQDEIDDFVAEHRK